jgi:hypothetical protein
MSSGDKPKPILIRENPLFYLRNFTLDDVKSKEKLSDIYNFKDDGTAILTSSNDNYKFKLFNMEIDNSLLSDTSSCSNLQIDINLNDLTSSANVYADVSTTLKSNSYNTICSKDSKKDIVFSYTPDGSSDAKTHTVSIGKREDNLKGLLSSITGNKDSKDSYDIINFQGISPQNIKKVLGDGIKKYKLVYIKKSASDNEYLTSLFNANKFTFIGYNIENEDSSDKVMILRIYLNEN